MINDEQEPLWCLAKSEAKHRNGTAPAEAEKFGIRSYSPHYILSDVLSPFCICHKQDLCKKVTVILVNCIYFFIFFNFATTLCFRKFLDLH